MPNPIIRIHNTETNEIIDREMNDDEYEQYKKDLLVTQKLKAEEKAKSEAKAVLLEKLGITEEEAKLLLG